MWNDKYITELQQNRERALNGGGAKMREQQHAKRKMTARERIDYLFDDGTFQEIGSQIESRFTDFEMSEKRLAIYGNFRFICR